MATTANSKQSRTTAAVRRGITNEVFLLSLPSWFSLSGSDVLLKYDVVLVDIVVDVFLFWTPDVVAVVDSDVLYDVVSDVVAVVDCDVLYDVVGVSEDDTFGDISSAFRI